MLLVACALNGKEESICQEFIIALVICYDHRHKTLF